MHGGVGAATKLDTPTTVAGQHLKTSLAGDTRPSRFQKKSILQFYLPRGNANRTFGRVVGKRLTNCIPDHGGGLARGAAGFRQWTATRRAATAEEVR